MMIRTKITRKEFLEKLIEGEKDFSRIRLQAGDLSQDERYGEVIKLFKARKDKKAKKEPICFKQAKMKEVNAPGLWLPYANFQLADLTTSIFIGGYFRNADFSRAILIQTNLSEADLTGVDLFKANLYHADLKGANVRYTNFSHADLLKTDLRNVSGLESAKHIGYAVLDHTIVTDREHEILEREQKKRKYFVISVS